MGMLSLDGTKYVYEKIFQFIGKSIHDINKEGQELYFFRERERFIYFVRDSLIRRASSLLKDNLVSYGTCIGKVSHSGRFRLTIGAMDLISLKSDKKVWLERGSDLKFLYGINVLKSGLNKTTKNIPKFVGV